MKKYVQEITYEEARGIAEENAMKNLKPYITSQMFSVLQEKYEEEECCWFFFRNEQIKDPWKRRLNWHGRMLLVKKEQLV